MKLIFAVALLVLFGAPARAQPLPASTNLALIDITGDGVNDIRYFADVANQVEPWRILTQLIPSTDVVFLQARLLNPFLLPESVIDQSTRVFSGSDGGNEIPFTLYQARRDEVGVWTFYDGGLKNGAGTRLEAIFGFRLNIEGTFHYGWVRFTRPNALLETLFTVADHNWNPVPGASIRAGQPPEIPITTEVLPDGTGLRLSWPSGISTWILESTPSLMSPVTWEPYPAGGSYADIPPEEAARYFRLRKPE